MHEIGSWLIRKQQEIATQYGVNPIIFLVLYLGTIPPYIYAWAKLIISIKRKSKQTLTWGIVVIGIFLLPYLYVLIWGRNLPSHIYVALIFLIIIVGWRACLKCKKDAFKG
jgi:hypothetical protein